MKDPTDKLSDENLWIRWLREERPWDNRGKQQRMPQGLDKLDLDRANIDSDGNMIGADYPAGVPCFGLPVPFLRYKGRFFEDRFGKREPARCVRCRINHHCERLVNQRLDLDQDLRKAADAYRHALEAKHFDDFAIGRERGAFLAELQKVTWLDAHRAQVQFAEIKVAEVRRRKEAARKRASRRGASKPFEIKTKLVVGYNQRLQALGAYLRSPHASGRDKLIPSSSVFRDCNVWLCRELLRARKSPVTPAAVLDLMEQLALLSRSEKRASLRAQIARSLKRVERWETSTPAGSNAPIWPAGDLRRKPVTNR